MIAQARTPNTTTQLNPLQLDLVINQQTPQRLLPTVFLFSATHSLLLASLVSLQTPSRIYAVIAALMTDQAPRRVIHKVGGQVSGSYQAPSQGATSAPLRDITRALQSPNRRASELPVTSDSAVPPFTVPYSDTRPRSTSFMSGSSLITWTWISRPFLSALCLMLINSFAASGDYVYKHDITITTTDVNMEEPNWPKKWTAGIPQSNNKTIRKFIRLDDQEANARLNAADQLARERKVFNWKKKIGTYVGNRDAGTPEDSSSACAKLCNHILSPSQVHLLIRCCVLEM